MAEGESMWKLMGGLLALPVLLVLSVLMIFWGSGDYVRTVQLNWELELPASEGCLYETDSGASFSGDGERYHVMESVQDAPDQTGAVKVELGTGETPDWSVLYVYEADGICCLEQPYTGIYQGDEALWTVLAADAAPEGRNPQ